MAIPATFALLRTGRVAGETAELAGAALNTGVDVFINVVIEEAVIEGGIEPVNEIGEVGAIDGTPLAVRRPVGEEEDILALGLEANEEGEFEDEEAELAVVDAATMLPPEAVLIECPNVTAVGSASVAVSVPWVMGTAFGTPPHTSYAATKSDV
ncbi:hypothetical protein MMC26_006740 [Xylographa opegraphella]|nr:hypothetical protein [Xylographa opegraphella]